MPGAALLVLLFLAGCLSSDAPLLDGRDPVPVGAVRGPFPADRTGCRDQNVGLLVPLATAQAAMPDGFEARDIGELLDAPGPTGQGLVALVYSRCDHAALDGGPVNEMSVMVYAVPHTPPSVVADDTFPGSEFVVLAVHTDAPGLAAWYAWWGVDVQDGVFDVAALPLGGATTTTGTDADGALYTVTADVTSEAGRSETNRYWYPTPEGLGLVTATRDAHRQLAGTNLMCTFRAGSPMAVAAARTDCAGVATLAVVYPDGDVTGEAYFWPA